MKLSSYLLRMRRLLADSSSWTKWASARNSRGKVVAPSDCSAVKFCLFGAVTKVISENCMGSTICALDDELNKTAVRRGKGNGVSFNDAKDTTHKDVLDLIESTRSRLRRQGR